MHASSIPSRAVGRHAVRRGEAAGKGSKGSSSDRGNAVKAKAGTLHDPPCASHRVPIDVLIHILSDYATLSPSCALNALLVSQKINSAIEEGVYGCVSLFSVRAMEAFQHLLKRKPELGRRVKALWIAPGRSDSDLIPALAPPTSNAALEARQRKVQSLAREILRSCRRLRHLALDGGFLTPQSAVGFGTACKPATLLCVNPHSFLGHFAAPIFRTTVRRLEVVDTTLAVEEVDEIRQMQALRHFIWTSPRANADVTRDVSVLLRILSPRARDAAEDDQQLMSMIATAGTAPPEKARQNEQLQSICTATSQARAAALAASFKKIVESVEVGDVPVPGQGVDEEDADIVQAMRAVKAGFYVDSSRANSSSIHKPTGVELQTRALSSLMQALTMAAQQQRKPRLVSDLADGGGGEIERSDGESDDDDDDEVVDEWEALRDVVCQRRTANTTASSRLFAGLGSGTTSMSGSGTFSVVRTGNTSGVSTPGWSVSRAASPARGMVSGSTSGPGSGAATPARYEEEIDGGRALQRVWRRWRAQVTCGELDMF